MAIYKAEAIVIRSRVYGEADSILTLMTREAGKVPAIAKGVRKPSSRLRGAVQLFSHTQLVLYSGRTLDNITQGEAVDPFSFLEQNVERMTAASYAAELADRLTEEHQPAFRVYQLLLNLLRALERGEPEMLIRVFEVQLLAVLGYRPRLDGCVLDGRPLENGPAWFSVERGGLLCPECAGKTPGAVPLLPATAKALDYFLRTPLEQAARVRLAERSRQELASLLRSFMIYHCDVRLRSWGFFDSMRSLNQ
jgi:DNA repair protein RecO (recombination protein O)